MKKSIYFIASALFVAAMGLTFTSCDSEDNPIELSEEIPSTVVDEVLSIVSEPLGKDIKAGKAMSISLTEASAAIEKIITEKGGLAIIYKKALGRSFNSNVIVCNYTISGSDMVIEAEGIGTVKVPMESLAEVMINNIGFSATSEPIAEPSSDAAVGLCRAWGNTRYSAAALFDEVPVWGYKDKEMEPVSSIRVLAGNIVKKLVTEKSTLTDEGLKILSNDLSGVNFLNNGKVYFTYSDGKVEESTWNWIDESKGKLKTTLDGEDVDVEVRFKKGTPNSAYFVVTANLKAIGGLGVHTLSGKLICYMTEI